MIRHTLDQHDGAGGDDLRWALETSIRLGHWETQTETEDGDGDGRRDHMQNGLKHKEKDQKEVHK